MKNKILIVFRNEPVSDNLQYNNLYYSKHKFNVKMLFYDEDEFYIMKLIKKKKTKEIKEKMIQCFL